MTQISSVAFMEKETVVAHYKKEERQSSAPYQIEADLEKEFVRLLCSQGYQYLSLTKPEELKDNLRHQLEKLNDYKMTDNEWLNFFNTVIANKTEGIVEKTKKIQQDNIQTLTLDDGTQRNFYLLSKTNPHQNTLQVINQFQEEGGKRKSRYDVTVLVNGLPLVHVELKRRGEPIKKAFDQINRYQRESFWGSDGLFEYIQIFVISNGTNTRYYSNTTRASHIKEQQEGGETGQKTSHSFQFTTEWADRENNPIPDLIDFTKTFFAKHTLLNILTKYCVLTAENLLLVMRPYQIAAAESVLMRVNLAYHNRFYGKISAGGYIWHATGSGKTLTSFKVAQLATEMPFVDKVLFVVDRKDLDYQTMKEYDRFEKGAANGNTSTAILKNQLENKDRKGNPKETRIIVTTIQKLSHFVKNNEKHPIYNQHIVFIFDECHRSQFGLMHKAIRDRFKKFYMYGFTGTPIFAENAGVGMSPLFRTTEQLFGERLHTYTITNARIDGKVLPFHVEFINTIKKKETIEDKKVKHIDKEKVLMNPERVSNIVSYILTHFPHKTQQRKHYSLTSMVPGKDGKEYITKRVAGFNSLFATDSIPLAILYYHEFKRQQEEKLKPLRVAMIYSKETGDRELGGLIPEDSLDLEFLDKTSKDVLEEAIKDYNLTFGTNFDTTSNRFEEYYKDISLRMKNREIDLLIVVDMFLTGFDATTLNTLWIDKNVQQHGLIQSFSRTNRILNDVKVAGNIVSFRNLKPEMDKAISLFGDSRAGGILLLKTYDDYYYGYKEGEKHIKGYEELVGELLREFPLGERIIGENNTKRFVGLFGAILRAKNLLSLFDEFHGNEILSERDRQDYQSIYLDFYDTHRRAAEENKEDITGDVIFEIDLVKQVKVDVDYVLMMIETLRKGKFQDKELHLQITRTIDSDVGLRSKRELINLCLARINAPKDSDLGWEDFGEEEREKHLQSIVKEENLKEGRTREVVERVFKEGVFFVSMATVDEIMPPLSRFGKEDVVEVKLRIIKKLEEHFNLFFAI